MKNKSKKNKSKTENFFNDEAKSLFEKPTIEELHDITEKHMLENERLRRIREGERLFKLENERLRRIREGERLFELENERLRRIHENKGKKGGGPILSKYLNSYFNEKKKEDKIPHNMFVKNTFYLLDDGNNKHKAKFIGYSINQGAYNIEEIYNNDTIAIFKVKQYENGRESYNYIKIPRINNYHRIIIAPMKDFEDYSKTGMVESMLKKEGSLQNLLKYKRNNSSDTLEKVFNDYTKIVKAGNKKRKTRKKLR